MYFQLILVDSVSLLSERIGASVGGETEMRRQRDMRWAITWAKVIIVS